MCSIDTARKKVHGFYLRSIFKDRVKVLFCSLGDRVGLFNDSRVRRQRRLLTPMSESWPGTTCCCNYPWLERRRGRPTEGSCLFLQEEDPVVTPPIPGRLGD